MIEIIVNGVAVEVEKPEDAVEVAKFVGREERISYYDDPEIFFCVDGEVVRRATLRSLSR